MSEKVIVLAVAVVGAFFVYKMAAALIGRFLPHTWWAKPARTIPGLGLGLTYIYFAGYYVMDKSTAIGLALLVALLPWAANIGWKVVSRERLIEE